MVKSFALMLVQVSISNVWYPLPFEEQTVLPIPSSVLKRQLTVLQYVSLAPKLAFPKENVVEGTRVLSYNTGYNNYINIASVAGVLAVIAALQSTRLQMRQEMFTLWELDGSTYTGDR